MFKCCGSTYQDVQDESIALDESYNPEFPFGDSNESFDEKFWQEVKYLYDNEGIDKATASRIVRVRRLTERCEGDVLVDLITTKHDSYHSWCKKNGAMDRYPTFVFELSELAEVILKEDFKREEAEYVKVMRLADGTRRTILHLAAERNLVQIMQTLLTKQKGLAHVTTSDYKYPLHYALSNNHDDAACKLIQYMPNGRVRKLFGDHQTDDPPTFMFCDIITHGGMKKTVEAVLDCLMNPDWPFIRMPKDDDTEGPDLPNLPLRYHFFYRLLDGDDEGQPGKKDGKINLEFNLKSKSCLQLLAEHSSSEDAMIRHPVVRMLMRSKWNKFGKFWMTIRCIFYALFLTVMSVAFLTDSSTPDRMEYSTHLDYFRLFCEILMLLFTLYFITSEVGEAIREKVAYLCDIFNVFDVLGLVLILAVIPLRFTKRTSAEFAVSAAAYLINFLRLSKCATAFKTMSVYMKTFSSIITKEISRFAVLFSLFILAFTGAVYLAMKSSNAVMVRSTNNSSSSSAYWLVFLQEIRSLAEASGFAETDTYLSLHVAVIILLMLNMFFFIVVLNNILIGQIGNSFSVALNNAKVKYDIDRTKLVTRIESEMLCFPWCLRTTHYVDAEFLNNEILEDDLLENWAMLKQGNEDKEKRKKEIKLMMTNRRSGMVKE